MAYSILQFIVINPNEKKKRSRCADPSYIDEWFENGAIFVAIKNPYKRIDTTAVAQHVIIKIDGEVVAETNAAVLLNETGQLEQYYIPATSIKNWGTVEKSELRTACPYKGVAS